MFLCQWQENCMKNMFSDTYFQIPTALLLTCFLTLNSVRFNYLKWMPKENSQKDYFYHLRYGPVVFMQHSEATQKYKAFFIVIHIHTRIQNILFHFVRQENIVQILSVMRYIAKGTYSFLISCRILLIEFISSSTPISFSP